MLEHCAHNDVNLEAGILKNIRGEKISVSLAFIWALL